MKKMFIAEAKKYQVFRWTRPWPRGSLPASEHHRRPQRVRVHPADDGLRKATSPLLLNTSYTITADIDVPQAAPKA